MASNYRLYLTLIILSLVFNLLSKNSISSDSTCSKKVDSLCIIANGYYNIDSEKSDYYFYEAMKIAMKSSDFKTIFKCYELLFHHQLNRGEYAKAYQRYILMNERILKLNDTNYIIKNNFILGSLYTTIGNYDDAIQVYESIFNLSQKTNNFPAKITSVKLIGNRYADIGKQNNDSVFINKAIQKYFYNYNLLLNKFDDNSFITTCNSLSDAYSALALITNNKSFYESSFHFASEALARSNIRNNINEGISALLNMGEIFLFKEDFKSALHYFNEAMSRNNDTIPYLSIFIYRNLSKTFKGLNNYDKALEYINKSIEISIKLNNNIETMRNYKYLSEIFEFRKNYTLALQFYKKHDSLNNLLKDESVYKQIDKMDFALKMEKNKQHIELLKKGIRVKELSLAVEKKQSYNLLILVISLIIVVAVFFYLNRKKSDLNEELDKAKQIAEETLKIQEMFLANTSHELRTPLNSIVGYTRLLKKSNLSSEQNEQLGIIEKSSESLINIVNDILDLSKIKSKNIVFNDSPFNMNETIRSCIELERIKSNEKNLELIPEIENTENLTVIGDALRLKQILLNLINNAIKFTDKGYIKISSEHEVVNENKIRLFFSIKDTGLGIPEDKQKYVFENFTQIDSGFSRKNTGTGLGLAICKQLVELQEGKIELVSQPDRGSEFKFYIDYKIVHNQNTNTIDKQTPLTLNKLKILIIDDVEFNLSILKKTLESFGASVDTCVSGAKAIESLIKNSYNVVLTDLSMPEMDGIELSRRIRKLDDPTKGAIPIIIISAANRKFINKEFDFINDFVLKPFIDEELITVILKHVKQIPADSIKHDYYDLTYLKEKASGDKKYFNDIIELFVKEFPQYLTELDQSMMTNNIQEVKKHAHKIKTPLLLIGAQSLSASYHQIENSIEQNNEIEKLKELINYNKIKCLQIIEDLKLEIVENYNS